MTKASKYIAFCLILWLTSCAGVARINLNASDGKFLNGIYVDPNIEIPKEFTQGNLAGNSAVAGAGLPGVLIATILQGFDDVQASKFSMQKVIFDNKIRIDQILNDQVQDYAKGHPSILLTDKDHAVSVLKLSVTRYGVSKSNPVGSAQHVMLQVNAKLEDLSGRIVWQDTSFVSGSSGDNDGGQSLETFSTDPTTLINALTYASHVVVAKLGDSLSKSH